MVSKLSASEHMASILKKCVNPEHTFVGLTCVVCKVTYSFCWCGRLNPCQHHEGKPQPEKKVRQKDFSGDSKFREENGQFQSKEGR